LPRVTDADAFQRAADRITVVERVWGRDLAFLERHRDRVSRVLREQRLLMVKGLLRRGRTRETRAVLKKVREAPLAYRILAMLPGPALRAFWRVRSGLGLRSTARRSP
jgi:hypothetical protein